MFDALFVVENNHTNHKLTDTKKSIREYVSVCMSVCVCISNIVGKTGGNGLNLFVIKAQLCSHTFASYTTTQANRKNFTCMLVWRLDTGEKTASRSVDSLLLNCTAPLKIQPAATTLPVERNGYGAGGSGKEWELKREPS